MVYDYPRDRVVLFGGMNGRMVFDETWEGTPVWARRDGTENMLSPRRVAWVKIPTAIAPPARWGHSMVYDDANERTLVFGGFDKNNQPLNDLWAFYGSRDVEVISTNSADVCSGDQHRDHGGGMGQDHRLQGFPEAVPARRRHDDLPWRRIL